MINQTASENQSSRQRLPLEEQLMELLSPWISPLGYQIIHLEVQSHRQKTLRLYIDYIEQPKESHRPVQSIGIEDCVKVSRALEEPIDQNPEIGALLPGAFELEVSSPGADRPLRSASDFTRFVGSDVRIHVFRPLTQEELGNGDYFEKNPKQKNFLGTLQGLKEDQVLLLIPSSGSTKNQTKSGRGQIKSGKRSQAKGDASLTTNSVEGYEIKIPLPLISKANLEPHFDFEASDERE